MSERERERETSRGWDYSIFVGNVLTMIIVIVTFCCDTCLYCQDLDLGLIRTIRMRIDLDALSALPM